MGRRRGRDGLRKNPMFIGATQELAARGITYTVDMDHKHPRICFRVNGRDLFKIVSFTTPGSSTGEMAACDIRRMIRDVERPPDPPSTPRRATSLAAQPAPAPSHPKRMEETMDVTEKTQAVSIAGTSVRIVEYRGQRVLTLPMVDALHERPSGTAGRTFRDHRIRFYEKDDFHEIKEADVIRRLGLHRPQGGTSDKVILLTQTGYLKLTKPLSDDRAWAVLGEMVRRYFLLEEMASAGSDHELLRRVDGISRMLSHKVTLIEQTVENIARVAANAAAGVELMIEELPRLRAPGVAPRLVPDGQEYVTAFDVVAILAEVPPNMRYRGITSWVTTNLQTHCIRAGEQLRLVPTHPGERVTFPRDACLDWLTDGGRAKIWTRCEAAKLRADRKQADRSAGRVAQLHQRTEQPARA